MSPLAGPVVGPLGAPPAGPPPRPTEGSSSGRPSAGVSVGPPAPGNGISPVEPGPDSASGRRRSSTSSMPERGRGSAGRGSVKYGRSPRSFPEPPVPLAPPEGAGGGVAPEEAPDPLLGDLRGANQSLVSWVNSPVLDGSSGLSPLPEPDAVAAAGATPEAPAGPGACGTPPGPMGGGTAGPPARVRASSAGEGAPAPGTSPGPAPALLGPEVFLGPALAPSDAAAPSSSPTGVRITTGGMGREPGMLMRMRVVSVVSVLGSSAFAPASGSAPWPAGSAPAPEVPYGSVPEGYGEPPRLLGPEDELSVSRLKAGTPGWIRRLHDGPKAARRRAPQYWGHGTPAPGPPNRPVTALSAVFVR